MGRKTIENIVINCSITAQLRKISVGSSVKMRYANSSVRSIVSRLNRAGEFRFVVSADGSGGLIITRLK